MLFFFKKKPIILDCFTYNSTVYDNISIEQANKFYPDWWKNLPKEYKSIDNIVPLHTMKGCKGFVDFYKNGIIIPMWEDFYGSVSSFKEQLFRWQTASNSQAYPHASEHWTGFLPRHRFRHLKIESPWAIWTKEFVQFAFVQPLYNQIDPTEYVFCPGVLDFKYQHGSHVNIMVEFRKEERNFKISAGTPVAMLIPLTEREIIVKNHLVSYDEWMQKKMHPVTFNSHWTFSKKFTDIKEKNKCPFNFGN